MTHSQVCLKFPTPYTWHHQLILSRRRPELKYCGLIASCPLYLDSNKLRTNKIEPKTAQVYMFRVKSINKTSTFNMVAHSIINCDLLKLFLFNIRSRICSWMLVVQVNQLGNPTQNWDPMSCYSHRSYWREKEIKRPNSSNDNWTHTGSYPHNYGHIIPTHVTWRNN